MDIDEMHDRMSRRFDAVEARIEGVRADMNGRIRGVERFQAKAEGMLVGWRVLPILIALAGVVVAGIAVSRT